MFRNALAPPSLLAASAFLVASAPGWCLAQQDGPAPSEPPSASFAPEDPGPTADPGPNAEPSPESETTPAPEAEPAPAPTPQPTPTAAPAAQSSPPLADPQTAEPGETASPPPRDWSSTPPPSTASSSSNLPASTPPPRSSSSSSSSDDDEGSGGGIYLDGNLGGTFGIVSTHGWNDDCPSVTGLSDPSMDWNPSCKTSPPLGVVLEGRLGVRVGALGIEGFSLGAVDWSSARLEGEQSGVSLPGFATNMQIGRVGGGLGLGLRAMSSGFFRVAAAAGGGAMLRHVFTNVSSLDGSSTGYIAPLVKGDLSFTLGKFLNFGVLGWVEFSPEVQVTPNLEAAGAVGGVDVSDPSAPPEVREMVEAYENALGDVTVFDGPQFFVGPFLGVHFGE